MRRRKTPIEMCAVSARVWSHKDFGICLSPRRNIRRQTAEMSGKKKNVSLDIFLRLSVGLVPPCFGRGHVGFQSEAVTCKMLGRGSFMVGLGEMRSGTQLELFVAS